MKTLLTLLLSVPIALAAAPTGTDQIQSDLRLNARLTSSAKILSGGPIDIVLQLTNTSSTNFHRVLKPTEGSVTGARQPHIYYSVQYLTTPNVWTNLSAGQLMGCGNTSAYRPDYADLKPGDTLPLKAWLIPVRWRFGFENAGVYRVRAHYDYKFNPKQNNDPFPTVPGFQRPDYSGLQKIPTFRLVSKPITITVRKPLEMRLRIKRPITAGKKTRLTDVFDLSVTNVSSETIELWSPADKFRPSAGFDIDLHDEKEEWEWGFVMFDAKDYGPGVKRPLKPGQSIPVIGADKFARGLDGEIYFGKPGNYKIRGWYGHPNGSCVVIGDWINLSVNPEQ